MQLPHLFMQFFNMKKYSQFFGSFCVFLVVLSFWLESYLLMCIACTLALIGLYIPFIEQFWGGLFEKVHVCLGRIFTYTLLGVFYYFIFTPFTWVLKFFRKPVLNLSNDQSKTTLAEVNKNYQPSHFTKPF